METRLLKTSPEKLEYLRKRNLRLKTKRLCISCQNPLKGIDKEHTRCPDCRAKAVKSRLKSIRRFRELGLCNECGKPASIGGKYKLCEVCWFRHIAKVRTGAYKNWLAIKELLQRQNYRCAYTGTELIIGDNASLDHITPCVKGGDNSITNLQWIDRRVNTIKYDMTHQEFILYLKSRITLYQLIIERQNP